MTRFLRVSRVRSPSQVSSQLFTSPSQVSSLYLCDLSATRVQVSDSSFHLWYTHTHTYNIQHVYTQARAHMYIYITITAVNVYFTTPIITCRFLQQLSVMYSVRNRMTFIWLTVDVFVFRVMCHLHFLKKVWVVVAMQSVVTGCHGIVRRLLGCSGW